MPNLKNIKDRISSIKNTQKITRAMKMVAAAKVKKAEKAVKHSRPFTLELYKMFSKICSKVGCNNFEQIKTKRGIDNYPALLTSREVKTLGLVVVSSNKGLAGAYSTNIVRRALKRIKEANAENISVKLYLIGQKAYAPIKAAIKQHDFEIKELYTGVLDDLNASSAGIIAEDLAEAYVNGEIDKIELLTTRYVNMMTYKVEGWELLPASTTDITQFHNEEFDKEHNVQYESSITHHIEAIMEFIPGVHPVLQKIVPMYVTNIIFQAMLEAQASELASRMTAMSAATNNAEDMVRQLSVQYNKVRQESITQEIIEVISGTLNK